MKPDISIQLSAMREMDEFTLTRKRLSVAHFLSVWFETPVRQLAALRWACEHDATPDEMLRWLECSMKDES